MRLIAIWALMFFVAAAIATLMLYDNGRVSMVWDDWVIETSLSFMLAVILSVLALGFVTIRLVMFLWNLPKTMANRRKMQRFSAAQNSMHEGLLALEYGDWQKAEKFLIKSAKNSESGLVHYLSAAKMAHNQGAVERRDYYLREAREHYPDDYVIIGLVEARLIHKAQPEASLAVLQALYAENPTNSTIIRDLAKSLQQQASWIELEKLMPKVKKSKAIVRDDLWQLERQLIAGKLTLCQDVDELDDYWKSLASKHKMSPDILAEYVEQRIGFGQEAGLKEWIEKVVNKRWDDRLVHQYGRLTLGPAFDRLKVAEKWMQGRDKNPVLLLTLGRLACQSQLWVMAQNYLKNSLRLHPQIETFHALALCYEAEGKESQAALIYKEAIEQLENTSAKSLKSPESNSQGDDKVQQTK